MSRGQNPRTLVLLTAIVFVVGAGTVYWQYSSMSAAADRLASVKKTLADASKLEAQVTETSARLAESQEQLNHLEKGVPEVAYIPTLLTEIEQVGRQCGIQVTGVKPTMVKPEEQKEGDAPKDAKPKPKKPYDEIEIDVTGRGSFGAVQSLLAALNRFPKIVSVRSVDIAPKRDVNGMANVLDATLKLRAYVFRAPKAGGSDAPQKVADASGNGRVSS